MNKPTFFKDTYLQDDFFASLVVFLVAMPLGLGIALASGAPVISGLIGCAVGGIVASFISGAPLQITGPAAGLTLIVFNLIQTFGWRITCAITVCAGITQLILSVAKIGRICLAITPAVVHGMLAGIGLMIALSQIHIIFGGMPQSSALRNLLELPSQLANLHAPATLLGLLTIFLLMMWKYVPPAVKVVPDALFAVTTTTIIATIFDFPVQRVDIPDHIFNALSLPMLPSFDQLGPFSVAVLTVSMVASVETMLCAIATDKLHDGKRADLDRELLGQGASNIISGLIGGLPVSGVIVRSSANVLAGAKSNLSGMLHGIWVLAFVIFFSTSLERIPLASLAGLLVYIGIRLIDLNDIKKLLSRKEATVYFVTLLTVTFINLLVGVGIGIGLSIIFLLRKFAKTQITAKMVEAKWHVKIEGTLTFMSVPHVTSVLNKIPPKAVVDIDLSVDFIDHAGLDALHEWRIAHEKTGGTIDIDERHEHWDSTEVDPSLVLAHSSSTRLKRENPWITKENRRKLSPRDVTHLIGGVLKFNRVISKKAAPLFTQLAQGQKPKALYIGCSDSRVVPNLITLSEPGEIFTLQNVGNLVPIGTDKSVAASIEYALNVLAIKNIIICGHSDCGAMKALIPERSYPQEGLGSWLEYAKPSLTMFKSETERKARIVTNERLTIQDQLSQLNVVVQMENLLQYPLVKDLLAQNKLHIWGLFFSIEEAQCYIFDARRKQFVILNEQASNSFLQAYDNQPNEPG